MKNKVIFAGCSFTWGQGLELAHPDNYGQDWEGRLNNWPQLSQKHIEFIKENRWTKLVCDELGYEEINVSRPGHSNGESVYKLKKYIKENGTKNLKYIFLQLTSEFRDFSFLEEDTTPITGKELALIIEKNLNENDGWNDINRMNEIKSKLDNNFDLMKERNNILLSEVAKWFKKLEKENTDLKCYLIKWNSEFKSDDIQNEFFLNLFDEDITVLEWSQTNKLTGQDWMKKNGFQCFEENHLSIEGMKIFKDIFIKKLNQL